MPFAILRRDPTIVDDKRAAWARDNLVHAMVAELKVYITEVEIEVRDTGPLDSGHAPIGIVILTDRGKDDWRVLQRFDIAKGIAKRLLDTGAIHRDCIIKHKSYVLLYPSHSAFVPIGHPDEAR